MDTFETVDLSGSDIVFSLKNYNPPISPVHDTTSSTGLNGNKIIETVLKSAKVKNAVSQIATKHGKTTDDIFKEVKEMLDNIGHTFNLKSIRFMGYILRKVFRNIYTGIKVNMKGLNKVKKMSEECPVILVPAHRSYTDFLLVSFVCFIFHLPLPVIAAAQDFKDMTLIGGLLRNCGAFYMKRSFRSDELYWLVFSEYVQCLLLNSGTMMEFFLEGTRSRSGKSLLPKQGLLSIITDLYFSSRVSDVLFCPISISYDRVLEESQMAHELLGVPKPRESLKGLLSSRSVLSHHYGYAYMYFGQPISLREFSRGIVDRTQRSCIPRSVFSEATREEMKIVRRFAAHISEKIQDHLIILPNMIIASIILQNTTGISLDGLRTKFQGVLDLCKKCNIPVIRNDEQDVDMDIIESLQLLKNSVTNNDKNEIVLIKPQHYPEEFKHRIDVLLCKNNFNEKLARTEDENSTWQSNNAEESLTANERTYIVYVTSLHLQLAHQRNQLLHWFYVPAIITLVSGGYEKIRSQDDIYEKAKLIGDLVSLEVAKESFPSQQIFFTAVESCQSLGILRYDKDEWMTNNTQDYDYITCLWIPIVTSYWIMCSSIVDSSNDEFAVNVLIKNSQDLALNLFLNGTVNILETQSLELFKNAIKSLGKLGLLQAIRKDSEQTIVVKDKSCLYNLTINLENILHLHRDHAPSLNSKL